MLLQWAAAAGRLAPTNTAVSVRYSACCRSPDHTGLHLIRNHSPLLCRALSAASCRWRCSLQEGSFLTFPLEKRHDGFDTLDVSSAHWQRPVDPRVPSFKCIRPAHSWGGNGLFTQHRRLLSKQNFPQIQTQFRGHIVNKRLTSGLVRQ